jgi:hypothetical protein
MLFDVPVRRPQDCAVSRALKPHPHGSCKTSRRRTRQPKVRPEAAKFAAAKLLRASLLAITALPFAQAQAVPVSANYVVSLIAQARRKCVIFVTELWKSEKIAYVIGT